MILNRFIEEVNLKLHEKKLGLSNSFELRLNPPRNDQIHYATKEIRDWKSTEMLMGATNKRFYHHEVYGYEDLKGRYLDLATLVLRQEGDGRSVLCDEMAAVVFSLSLQLKNENPEYSAIHVSICSLKNVSHTVIKFELGEHHLFYDPWYQYNLNKEGFNALIVPPKKLKPFVDSILKDQSRRLGRLPLQFFPITKTNKVFDEDIGTMRENYDDDASYYVRVSTDESICERLVQDPSEHQASTCSSYFRGALICFGAFAAVGAVVSVVMPQLSVE
ncbi:hypothetical protein Psal006b_02957 [Piscirickettsia salmonis]|uniref:Glutaminyl-tRNA synthetase n=1 Tax=Piscirickettsia salmonis TaxID=1238 RepID=A0AAC9EUI4_PISSA|nr:hypothetical protein [Piscirickettsia salmonis]AKP72840.2 hypothetical protein PSLF89_744 [Piscirickettsia salmonis LF-89 = ATCC VR-1361]ALB21449.1 glutaminyl-tRNA synthetase [Piscirickettsia salmonis]ALY01676.1 hypothetical protein AWE47_01325 [Piscirickettsia salmonis]AMA41192.1 hypothetical protein AWJ11_01335 [Piscirickettsia salmonis]AOS36379.1 hypothetical protein AVM72_14320 [Piscirickettsia salmonis]